MSVLFGSNAFRALLIAAILAAVAAFMAPKARGAGAIDSVRETESNSQVEVCKSPADCSVAILADGDWSWREFVKFWQRQGGTLNGVVGTVMLVALVAVLIICSKGRA